MDQIVKKVQELGLTLPQCPAPIAAYVPATRNGDTIFVSGQLPSVNGDFSAFCGSVPKDISVEKAALTLLEEDETLRLVQMQGFVQSSEGFHEQPAVLNGASELAVKIFGENGKHARTAVGVSNLPKNVAVEISCTFQVIKAEAKFTGRYGWIEG